MKLTVRLFSGSGNKSFVSVKTVFETPFRNFELVSDSLLKISLFALSVTLYTAISRKVVGKVHSTIPKGIMSGFEFTVLPKTNLKECHERLWTYVYEFYKSRFDSCRVRNSALITSHIAFRDCRVYIFFDNLSLNSCI